MIMMMTTKMAWRYRLLEKGQTDDDDEYGWWNEESRTHSMLSPVFSTFSPVRFYCLLCTAPFDTLHLLVIAFAFFIKYSSSLF